MAAQTLPVTCFTLFCVLWLQQAYYDAFNLQAKPVTRSLLVKCCIRHSNGKNILFDENTHHHQTKVGKDGHLLAKQIVCICQIYTSTPSSFFHPFMYLNTIHQNFVCWRHFSFVSLLQLSTSVKKTYYNRTALYTVVHVRENTITVICVLGLRKCI